MNKSLKLALLGVYIVLLAQAVWPQMVNAQSCRAVFPDVASSYSNAGTIRIGANSRLYDTDTILDVSITADNATRSCDSGPCVSSGRASQGLTLASFNYTNSSQDIITNRNTNYDIYQSSYDDITIERNSSMIFYQNNTVTRLDTLTAKRNARIILEGGVYWINKLVMEKNSTVEIYSDEKVILYVNNTTFEDNVDFNVNGSIDQLVVVAYNDFTFEKNSKMNGFLFVQDNLSFDKNNNFNGAFNAKTINVGPNVKLYTRLADIDTAKFDGTCSQNDTLPEPVHYYSMDMCSVPSGNNAIDDEAGNNDGDVTGSIGIDFSAKYCQGVSLSGEQSFIDIPDPAATQDLAEGTISLYFKTPDLTHSNTPSAGSMAFFSRDHNGTENGGHLTLWLSDSGAIVVRQQNANSSHNLSTVSQLVTENQWHHLAYSWGANGMRLYLDGQAVGQKSSYTGGLNANGRDMALGANSWRYRASSSASRSSQMKDFFKGAIDELKIFDRQLSASQISALEQVASQPCKSCSADPVLVSHWSADVCSFEQNQLTDVETGINGIIQNGISNTTNSRFCQGLAFDGNQSYATVTHDSRLQISQGAISLWFTLPNLSYSSSAGNMGNVLLSKGSVNWANGDHLEISVDEDGRVNLRHQEIGESSVWQTPKIIQENQWHHLVYSFGPAGAYIFIDGQQRFHEDTYFNGLETNDDTLVFGASSRFANRGSTAASNYAGFMLGELDEIKLYRNQPSAADINEWYQQSTGPCTTCSTLLAEYNFDQTNSESSTTEDSSGNGNNGVYGSSVNSVLLADNIGCRAIELPTNSGVSDAYYFDTGVTPRDIGNQGSISFWYRAKEDWNDGNSRQLFDASESVNNKYFFLVKKGNGALAFGLEDTNDNDLIVTTNTQNFAADTWVHISVQWDLVGKAFSVYINGQAQALDIVDESISANLAKFESLVFGDSRSNYLVTPASATSASGFFDDIRIYSQVISAAQIQADISAAQACEVVHHYLIEHPQNALTCDMPLVTIKACANASCSVLSSIPSTLVLSPDKFEPANSVTFTGQTQLSLNNQAAGTLTIGATSQDPVAPVACSDNCEVAYENAGIQFFNTITGQSNFSDAWFIAQENLSNVGIKIAGNNGGACEGLVDGQQDIELTYACVNTASASYTPAQCNVAFAGIDLSTASTHTGIIELSFNQNGEADLSRFSFADAGILNLRASAIINGAVIAPSSVNLNIVPSYLSITGPASMTITAGEPLGFTISAYGVDDVLLPGFQANDLEISVTRVLPSDSGALDAQFYFDRDNSVTSSVSEMFGDVSVTFTAGETQSNSAYFEEVGTYSLNVRDNNYLGTRINSSPITLSRVIPAYFDVQKAHQPVLQNTCNTSFTYVGETFGYLPGLEPSYTITAYNALGQITQNYARELWRLDFDIAAISGEYQLTDTSIYSGVGEQVSNVDGVVLSGTDIYDGKATLALNGLTYRYPKVVSPIGNDASPFTANFEYRLLAPWFTDSDNVCYQSTYPSACSSYNTADISGANMRYGRINMENAFGPETETLTIPVYSEYLDAGQWRVNTDDSCSMMTMQQTSGHIAITHDVKSTLNLATKVTNLTVNSPLLLGILSFDALAVGPFTSDSEALSGSFYIKLLPSPVSGHWSNHLNYDWDGDGDIDSDDGPAASVTLGIYRTNDRTLHWREVLN